MGRVRVSIPDSRRVAAIALSALALGIGGPSTGAEPSERGPARRPAAAAGVTVVAVTTSAARPDSRAFLEALRSHPWFVANARRIRLVEVPSEGQATTARLGLNVCPAITAYSRGPRGLEILGGRSGFSGVDEAIGWLRDLESGAVPAGSPRVDPAVEPTGLERGSPLASAQGPMASGTAPAVPSPQVISAPGAGTTTGGLCPSPGRGLAPPVRIVLVPQVATTTTGTSDLFMPATVVSGSVGAPLAAGPLPLAMPQSPAPMVMVPMAAVPAGPATAGPGACGAHVTTHSISVPASRTSSRVRVRAPGPCAAALARFGERLALLGRTRIETVYETQLETEVARSAPAQFMTLSSTAAGLDWPPRPVPPPPADVPGPPPTGQQPPESRPPLASPQTQPRDRSFGRHDD